MQRVQAGNKYHNAASERCRSLEITRMEVSCSYCPPTKRRLQYERKSINSQHGGARDKGGARRRVCDHQPAVQQQAGGGRHHHCSLVTGATEAEPAVGTSSQQEKRGRETAGLPQGGKTPLGSRFFKHWDFIVNLCPHFHFSWGQRYLVCCLLESLSFL